MADYGRYDENTRTRGINRDRDRDYGRRSGGDRGMFDYGRSERGRSEERGWAERSYGDRSYGERDRGDRGHFGRDRDRSSLFGRDRDRERSRSHDRDRDRGRGRERSDRGYGSDDFNRGLAMDETSKLIASNKVEGTAVYGSDGEKLGSIYNFMVDKYSGRVKYAVMRYSSGFLGFGERYYPLPWKVLDYDTRAGGYCIDMTEEDLENAPSFDRDSEPRFNEDYDDHVHDYYGMRRRR
ncbi:MAG: PRC-barrel domain-containing protein [Allosphingosinicella sp.]